jgi:hypothetical protein
MSKPKPIVVPEKLCRGTLYNGELFCSWGYLINKVLRVPKNELFNKNLPTWYQFNLYSTLEKRYKLKHVDFKHLMSDNDQADRYSRRRQVLIRYLKNNNIPYVLEEDVIKET